MKPGKLVKRMPCLSKQCSYVTHVSWHPHCRARDYKKSRKRKRKKMSDGTKTGIKIKLYGQLESNGKPELQGTAVVDRALFERRPRITPQLLLVGTWLYMIDPEGGSFEDGMLAYRVEPICVPFSAIRELPVIEGRQ